MGSGAGLFQNRRVYILAAVAYIGALLFGFDTGVMGSVLALDSFKEDFGLPLDGSGFASQRNADISSNVVSLLTAGAFFGAIASSVANDRIGRRVTLFTSATIFVVGAALQTAARHDISSNYGGRVVAGFGIGGLTGVMSVYVSENAPPKIRGRIAGLFQKLLVIGATFASWGPTPWVFFVITKITPLAIANEGWRTFVMFAVFCLAMGVFVFLFVPETKQRTPDEIDVLFGAVDAETRHRDVEDVLASKEPVEGGHIEAARA